MKVQLLKQCICKKTIIILFLYNNCFMSSKKTISISPDLLSGKSSSKTKKRRERKKKPTNVLKPNTLKKALLKRIKEHAAKERSNQDNKTETREEEAFANDFDKHLNYLTNLSKEKRKNKTQKKQLSHNSPDEIQTPVVNIDLPRELESSPSPVPSQDFKSTTSFSPNRTPPPYGCLKNGNKPTYKQWKRQTQKKMDTIDIIDPEPKSEPSSRAIRLEDIRKRLKENNIKQQQEAEKSKQPTLTKRRTCKRKYKFGKNTKKNKVSVLIKNTTTRKNVQQEYNIIKNTPIAEVKEYLKEKALLKAGSLAPNDVLRKTYEQLHLAGDISNKNGDILVHNYMNS